MVTIVTSRELIPLVKNRHWVEDRLCRRPPLGRPGTHLGIFCEIICEWAIDSVVDQKLGKYELEDS